MTEWLWQSSGYIALLTFFGGFCAMAVWIYLPRNRKRLESFREIPFEKGDK